MEFFNVVIIILCICSLILMSYFGLKSNDKGLIIVYSGSMISLLVFGLIYELMK